MKKVHYNSFLLALSRVKHKFFFTMCHMDIYTMHLYQVIVQKLFLRYESYMVFKNFYKIKLYSIVFWWQPPPLSRKLHFVS